jgi:hypothetical protein
MHLVRFSRQALPPDTPLHALHHRMVGIANSGSEFAGLRPPSQLACQSYICPPDRVFRKASSAHPTTLEKVRAVWMGAFGASCGACLRPRVTGANTDPAQCVFCPFCGGAAPWHSFKFPTAVARLQRLIFRSRAVPAHKVECAGAVRCKIFTLKYLYKIIQDHSTKAGRRGSPYTCSLYCGLG